MKDLHYSTTDNLLFWNAGYCNYSAQSFMEYFKRFQEIAKVPFDKIYFKKVTVSMMVNNCTFFWCKLSVEDVPEGVSMTKFGLNEHISYPN